MMQFYEEHKRSIHATILGIIAIVLVAITVPTFKPDPEHPVVNATTHLTEPGKQPSSEFVIMMILASLVPIIYLMSSKEEKEFARTRSLIKVWADIPQYELVKFGLKHAKHMIFNHEAYKIPTKDANLFIVRFPDYNTDKFTYLALDMGEDWKTRNADSPLFAIMTTRMGINQAKSDLIKNTAQKYTQFVQTAKSLNISPDEIRRQIATEQIAEAERRRRELEGDLDEG
jgi:hypothetical protein